MNERIKQIAEQAGIAVWGDAVYRYNPKDTLDLAVLEKFAELIVRECVEVCHKMAEDSDSYVVHDGDTCAKQIKQHFEVEE